MQTITARSFTDSPSPEKIRHDIEEDPRAFVTILLTGSRFNFGAQEIIAHGRYKEMGYSYDLRAFLKLYVYLQYGSWQQAYALNRTNLRKLTFGRIDKILEVK